MDPLTLFKNRIQNPPNHVSSIQLREWLSKNPSITLDMILYDIQTNPTYKDAWKFKYLARVIPVEELVEHDILPEPDDLDSPHLTYMKINITTLLKTHTRVNYNWDYMTKHPNIKLEDIQAHPELPWDYTSLMFNPNFEFHHMEIFKPYINKYVFYNLSYVATCEQIMQYPDENWLPIVLGCDHMQKEDVVKILPYFQEKYKESVAGNCFFIFSSVCCNPNLTFEDLIELFGEELPLKEAHTLTSFTFNHFKKYFVSNKKLPITTMENLTFFHPILPLEFIKAHPKENWIWSSILQNNNTISYDRFNELPKNIFPDMSIEMNEWHMRHMLFNNKHLSHYDKKCILEELLKSPIPPKTYNFSHKHLIESPLFLEPTFEEIKEYFAKKRMIRLIVEVITNPTYLQCRKRLTREYSKITSV